VTTVAPALAELVLASGGAIELSEPDALSVFPPELDSVTTGGVEIVVSVVTSRGDVVVVGVVTSVIVTSAGCTPSAEGNVLSVVPEESGDVVPVVPTPEVSGELTDSVLPSLESTLVVGAGSPLVVSGVDASRRVGSLAAGGVVERPSPVATSAAEGSTVGAVAAPVVSAAPDVGLTTVSVGGAVGWISGAAPIVSSTTGASGCFCFGFADGGTVLYAFMITDARTVRLPVGSVRVTERELSGACVCVRWVARGAAGTRNVGNAKVGVASGVSGADVPDAVSALAIGAP